MEQQILNYCIGQLLGEVGGGRVNPGVDHIVCLIRATVYAHHNGVIRRDIKPANIIITQGSQIKVADFEMAKIARAVRVWYLLDKNWKQDQYKPEIYDQRRLKDHYFYHIKNRLP